ncbi:MAG: ABC transporter permease [Planctomycetes bacterium]|nr:ABC transporter permease [Planctomycetota bacterium]
MSQSAAASPPASSASPPVQAEATAATVDKTYWATVAKQFRRNTPARVGLWMVLLFAALALGSSYIANDRPLLLRRMLKPAGAAVPMLVTSFPAWEFSEKAERLALVLAAGVLLWKLARALRRAPRGSPGRPLLTVGAILWGVAVLGVCVAIGVTKTRLDITDYARLSKKLDPAKGEFAVWAPIRHSPYATDLDVIAAPPSPVHRMGTDMVGRDLFTRILHGTKIALLVGLVAVTIELLIGVTLGALAGYYGGLVDLIVSRIIEVFLCFPTFFLLITIVAFLPRNIFLIMIVIGLTGWPHIARLIRGEFLKVRKQDYVAAARALGVSDFRIMFRHILPNAVAPALVAATFGIAGAILAESSLTFLGFGVDPSTPTWGEALHEAWENYRYWWLAIYPGLAIFLTVTAYNLVGEGLRDAIDPRLKT